MAQSAKQLPESQALDSKIHLIPLRFMPQNLHYIPSPTAPTTPTSTPTTPTPTTPTSPGVQLIPMHYIPIFHIPEDSRKVLIHM